MALFKKRRSSGREIVRVDQPNYSGDPRLPGIAGYQGVGKLPKGAMPVHRFNYVRPDGRRDE
jgi:hypothetical protein